MIRSDVPHRRRDETGGVPTHTRAGISRHAVGVSRDSEAPGPEDECYICLSERYSLRSLTPPSKMGIWGLLFMELGVRVTALPKIKSKCVRRSIRLGAF